MFPHFLRRVLAIPFSEQEWICSAMPILSEINPPDVEYAAKFFVRCRQSMAGRMKSFTPLTKTRTRGEMNAEVHAWIGSVDGLPAVHRRFRRVVILNNLARNVIKQQDGKDTLFYLDPPYLPQTRTAPDVYEYEMGEGEHLEMLDLANECKGKVIISGYHSPMYGNALRPDKWTIHEFPTANHSGSGEKKQNRIEVVWCNFRSSR